MSKLKKRIFKIKKRLDSRALRMPKTKPQIRDRLNWERVYAVIRKRYE